MFQKIKFHLLMSYDLNRPFYQLVFILTGLIAAVLLTFGILTWTRGGDAPEADPDHTRRVAPVIDTRNTAALRKLIEEIYEAHGSRGSLEHMHSFTRHGELQTPSQVLQVVYTYKRPNLLSYTMGIAHAQVRVSYDGRVAWTQTGGGRERGPVTFLPESEARFLDQNARMNEPVSTFLADLAALEWLEDAPVGDIWCHVIQWSHPEHSTLRFYFDRESLLLRQRERIQPPGPDKPEGETLAAVYGDYRRVSSAYYPFREEVIIDGKPLNVLSATGLKINPGIIDLYFSPPVQSTPP